MPEGVGCPARGGGNLSLSALPRLIGGNGISQSKRIISMETQEQKIAFVTDDGQSISSHFGRAVYYEVITIAEGKLQHRERRSKAGHHTFGGPEHQGESHDHKHGAMTSPITDCQVLVARGMGMGAHHHLLSLNITPLLTDLHTIDEAVEAYLTGKLTNNPQRLHEHGQGHTH
jgi:predicted Fe-Mo cluster-binding NifX family protein